MNCDCESQPRKKDEENLKLILKKMWNKRKREASFNDAKQVFCKQQWRRLFKFCTKLTCSMFHNEKVEMKDMRRWLKRTESSELSWIKKQMNHHEWFCLWSQVSENRNAIQQDLFKGKQQKSNVVRNSISAAVFITQKESPLPCSIIQNCNRKFIYWTDGKLVRELEE